LAARVGASPAASVGVAGDEVAAADSVAPGVVVAAAAGAVDAAAPACASSNRVARTTVDRRNSGPNNRRD
jgi:hypothetical protein